MPQNGLNEHNHSPNQQVHYWHRRVTGWKLKRRRDWARFYSFFALCHQCWNNPRVILYITNALTWLKRILKQDMWCSSGIAHKRVSGDLPSERPWWMPTLKRRVAVVWWLQRLGFFFSSLLHVQLLVKKKKKFNCKGNFSRSQRCVEAEKSSLHTAHGAHCWKRDSP